MTPDPSKVAARWASQDEPIPDEYAGDLELVEQWQGGTQFHVRWLSDEVKDLLRSGDVPMDLIVALRRHYGFTEDARESAGHKALTARHLRLLYALRDKHPYFFKPPRQRAYYRGVGLRRASVEKLIGPIEPARGKTSKVPVDLTFPLRWNKHWTTNLRLARSWASGLGGRIPLVLHTNATDLFVLNVRGMHDLIGFDRGRWSEQEVVPVKSIPVSLIELQGWKLAG